MKILIKQIIVIIVAIALCMAFVWSLCLIIGEGMEKSARAECYSEREQASQYHLWYATSALREQCKALHITLPSDNAMPF